jgi:hypothetical protein
LRRCAACPDPNLEMRKWLVPYSLCAM